MKYCFLTNQNQLNIRNFIYFNPICIKVQLFPLNKRISFSPCLVWLSGLSASMQTKGSPVLFPVRAHACVVGQAPVGGTQKATTHWFFSPASPSLSLSLKIKSLKKKKRISFSSTSHHTILATKRKIITISKDQHTNKLKCVVKIITIYIKSL